MKKPSANRLTLAFIIAVSPACLGRPLQNGETRQKLAFTVLTFDFARLPRQMIAQAETEATRIFRKAGVETIWLNCPPPAVDADEPAACQRTLGPLEFVLRIVRRSETDRAALDHCALGFTLLEGDQATYATLLYDCIAQLAADHVVSPPQLLGHAMAHEIGHLFLGANAHSPSGLMRERWDEGDLQQAARRNLHFTEQQAELVRASILTRMRERGPSQVHTRAAEARGELPR